MLKFEWNALREGGDVLLHDPASPQFALGRGVVALTEARHGAQGVGIRMTGERSGVVWPSRMVVHLNRRDDLEPCWRCESLAGQDPGHEDGHWPRPLLTVVAPT